MRWLCCAAALLLVGWQTGRAGLRSAAFDRDPGWEGANNRSAASAARAVRQDFGYSRTAHAGGRTGEVGGTVTPAAEPAYCARPIHLRTLEQPLAASGTLAFTSAKGNVLLGFFNHRALKEWRTPNTVAIRLLGRGDVFYAYVEYCTGRWRAGADSPGGFATVVEPGSGRRQLRGFVRGKPYRWSLQYDPAANSGAGSIRATIGDETAVCDLAPGHRADGATFDRFGLLNVLKSADDSAEVWIDDVAADGLTDGFDHDPRWDEMANRRTYRTTVVRPHGDFGWSPTRHAGGRRGEIGGVVFRGDCRYPGSMACYGDRLSPLRLDAPIEASGRIALCRAVSDSTTLIGFYHAERSMAANPSQRSMLPRCFLGLAIEGPSREGFFLIPAYRSDGDEERMAWTDNLPRILPDGAAHTWRLRYEPPGAGASGRLTVTLDARSASVDVPALGDTTEYDRFGFVTTWIDGNSQTVYLDDLTYTAAQR